MAQPHIITANPGRLFSQGLGYSLQQTIKKPKLRTTESESINLLLARYKIFNPETTTFYLATPNEMWWNGTFAKQNPEQTTKVWLRGFSINNS